jgi:similar to stage IV sporulation protein
MGIKDFKKIRPVAKKSKCKVRLLNKVGLPFIINKYRKRKLFFAGAFIFLALIIFLSSFIWNIEITGNDKIEASRLESELAQMGIKIGAFKFSINTDDAVNRIMLDSDDISWISIFIKGTKVCVELRERIPVPEIIPDDIPCDVVAKRDGVIKSVIAKGGKEAVVEGETVTEGQVLISGKVTFENKKDEFLLVHAMGTVTARTWYQEEVPVKLKEVERLQTGRTIKDHSLVFFSSKVDLLHQKNKFKNYSTEEVRKKLSIGPNLVFPIEWVTQYYYEEEVIETDIDEEIAKNIAAEEAYNKVVECIPEEAEIIKKSLDFIEDEKTGLTARVTLECLEDIGVTRKIGGN